MSKAVLKQVLERYFTNFSNEKFDFSLFKGQFTLNDLVFNPQTFNSDFDKMNIPFMFKFGILKKMLVDVSIFDQCLEEIVLEDLVLVIGPDPSKSDREFALSPEERLSVLLELAQRHNEFAKWQTELNKSMAGSAVPQTKPAGSGKDSPSKPGGLSSPSKLGPTGSGPVVLDPAAQREVAEKLKQLKQSGPCKSLPKNLAADLLQEANNDLEAFRGVAKPEYKTPEQQRDFLVSLVPLVLGNINAKVRINNLRIYYEDRTTLAEEGSTNSEKDKGFAICLALDGIKIAKVKPEEALTPDKSFRGMFNMSEFPNLSRTRASEPDFFQIHLEYFGLEVNVLKEPMVPEEMSKKDLKNTANVNELTKYFKEFAETHKHTAFTLMAARGIRLDVMGAHDDETVVVLDRLQLYNIVAVSLHMGDVSINFDLEQLNDFLKVVANLRAIMLLSQTAEFRPFFKPITKKTFQEMDAKFGPQIFNQEVRKGLTEIGKLIVKDYFRLFMFTKLLRSYGGTDGLDVRKRLVWKFKKSSLIYQMLMGCTLSQLMEKEKQFFDSEKKFMEMKKAIQLHERLMVEDQIKIAAGETPMEVYVKNIRNVSELLNKVFLNIRISIGIRASLVDLDDCNVNDLDIGLGNHVIEFKKPKGDLKGQFSYRLDRLFVKIEEPKILKATELQQSGGVGTKGLTEYDIRALVTGANLRNDTEAIDSA